MVCGSAGINCSTSASRSGLTARKINIQGKSNLLIFASVFEMSGVKVERVKRGESRYCRLSVFEPVLWSVFQLNFGFFRLTELENRTLGFSVKNEVFGFGSVNRRPKILLNRQYR